MGAEASSLVPKPIGFDYMSITYHAFRRIRLLYADEREISIVRECILQHWKKGIDEELSKLDGAFDFSLNGSPFDPTTLPEKAIAARRMTCNILFRLYNSGCKLLVSSDLSRLSDLTTWFFHREPTLPLQFEIACIGMRNSDKLHFINFPPVITQAFENVVTQVWTPGLQKCEYIGDGSVLAIKLRGDPWKPYGGAENTLPKTLLIALINHLSMQQWGLYGSNSWKGNFGAFYFKYDPHQPVDGSLATGFIISLGKKDRIRCIDAPDDVPAAVKSVICQNWRRGLQAEKPKFNSIEFKLAGCPWWVGGKDSIASRLLMCKILEKLMTIGWRLQLGFELSMNVDCKACLAFQRCPPATVSIFCLSLNGKDQIRFVNAPPNVVTALQAEIARTWLFGIAKEKQQGEGCLELKLNRNPWVYSKSSGHNGAHARVMLSYIIKACAQLGWFLILAADVSSKYVSQEDDPDYPKDVDSMWFIYLGFGGINVPQPSFAPVPPLAAPLTALFAAPFAAPLTAPHTAPFAAPHAAPFAAPLAPPQYGTEGRTQFDSAFSYAPAT